VLQLQRLTRRYGDPVAPDGQSFTLAEGQTFGFVGPNGAGKTTAMRIVLGVLESDAGQVPWFRPMTDRDVQMRRTHGPGPRPNVFFDSALLIARAGRSRMT
jgi:ABC-2 type transport system ATP-binding protein